MGSRTIYACRFLVVAALICAALAAPASARREVQEWHGFGRPEAASVDSTDGSVWAAMGTRVYRLSATGAVLSYAQLYWPSLVAASPFDGSCWVLDRVPSGPGAGYSLVQVSAEGTVLCRLEGLVGNAWPPAVLSVSPNDGTCWIAWSDTQGHLVRVRPGGHSVAQWDTQEKATCIGVSAQNDTIWVGFEGYAGGGYVAHLTPDAAEISRSSGFLRLSAVAVDAADGSVWVVEPDPWEVVHLDADGQELWRGRPYGEDPTLSPPPSELAADPTDGSCWVAGPGVVRLSAAGEVMARVDSLESAHGISCNAADGSLWAVAHQTYGGDGSVAAARFRLYHLDRNGAMLLTVQPEIDPWAIAADPTDGSCWVLDANAMTPPPDTAIAQVSTAGAILGRTGTALGGLVPHFIEVDPQDGSFWVGLGSITVPPPILAHLNAAGEEIFRKVFPVPDDDTPYTNPFIASLSLDPGDGSCWIAIDDLENRECQILHFAADGTQLLDQQWPMGTEALCVSAIDGSVWVANYPADTLTHLSRQGVVLSQRWVAAPECLATNARDGSVWVAGSDGEGARLFLFAADGAERWQLPQLGGSALAVDPTTGFCWAAQRSSLAIYSYTGQELWRSLYAAGSDPGQIAVDPATGACWVVLREDELARVRVPLTPFGDVAYSNWARDEINACAEAGIVQGYSYGLYTVYHPDQEVTRDQMAVYLARASAGGDGAVPEPVGQPTFTDVGADHWAYRYIEYCYANGIVQGYWNDTYHPGEVVTRDQMAVYIARALAGGDELVPTGPAEALFSDVGTDHWAYDYVSYCQAEGIVQGYSDGSYHPDGELTRDQMAVFIARAFDLSLEWPADEPALLAGPPEG